MAERLTPGMAEALESAFAKARTEREAKEAAQLAADSVPTDNIVVLRERATRHATEAIDEYWGHFGDMQLTLNQRVITPLLNTVTRIAAERDKARAVALNDAADEVVASCPDHSDRDEAWMDCHCAVADELRRMAAAPAVPVPDNAAADVPEFAVRWPDGELTRAADREHGLRAIESAHRAEPGAVLMQRSCTPWTEVTS